MRNGSGGARCKSLRQNRLSKGLVPQDDKARQIELAEIDQFNKISCGYVLPVSLCSA